MASKFDESDFVDADLEAPEPYSDGAGSAEAAGAHRRPPSREELDHRVTESQGKLLELKRAQEQLERERALLEEGRRRRSELEMGKGEMLHCLVRGVQLMEEAEFEARSDAEQKLKSLQGLREALEQVQRIREESWTEENWEMELTRALAAVESARMEWNSARLKWPELNGILKEEQQEELTVGQMLAEQSYGRLCKVGLALTWPIALVMFLGFAAVALVMLYPR